MDPGAYRVAGRIIEYRHKSFMYNMVLHYSVMLVMLVPKTTVTYWTMRVLICVP